MNVGKRIWVVGVIALSMTAAPVIRAQYTADFQTNIISGVTSNWSGGYNVGNANSADALVIQSSGVLGDTAGVLGETFGSSNNSALVTDSGSIWSNRGEVVVGNQGVGNSLVISNSGQVLNLGSAYLGGAAFPITGSNSALVTGSGSTWSNVGDLMVGVYQSCNRVVVNHGGLLINNNAFLGSGGISSGSNNSVLVSDGGSVWTNRGDLHVGESGAACSLVISNGGKVFSGFAYAGYNTSSSNNTVAVIGSGSFWTNRNDLSIGLSAARNSLTILNSGVVCSSIGYIGNNATAASNSVMVSGTGSVWRIVNGLYVGNSSAGNSLVISNGARLITHFSNYAGNDSSSSNNHVLVTGAGSVWDNTDPFNAFSVSVGYSGAGNSLVISGGGKMIVNNGTLGVNTSASNNSVLVTDTGSVWSNSSGSLYVGYSGARNSLVISNGGQVVVGSSSFLGGSSLSSSNNSVVVSGTGSVWSTSFGMTIGNSGGSNSMVINNGGRVVNDHGAVGNGTSRKNSAVVSGSGSVWSNLTDLTVGDIGSGNSLVIKDGGLVVNGDCYIARSFGTNNSIRVENAAVMQNNTVHVGEQGSGNSLIVSGAVVYATNLIVGVDSAVCDNLVELDDSGVLSVTNATHDAVLEVRNGQLIINSGTVQVDILVMTNACARIVRNGGTVIVGTLVLDPSLDADGDGLPNGWEQQYGLDPLDGNGVNGPAGDPDGDGLSNLQEYLAGSNPVADIKSIMQEGNDIRVTWGAALGKTNALQATAGDVGGSYSTNNFADIFTVTGSISTITNYLDVGSATNFPARYYRVRLVP